MFWRTASSHTAFGVDKRATGFEEEREAGEGMPEG